MASNYGGKPFRWISERPLVNRISETAIGMFQNEMPSLEFLTNEELRDLWFSMHQKGADPTSLFVEAIRVGKSRSGKSAD